MMDSGNGQPDDQRRPPVEEEEEDEDDGQDAALPGVVGGPLRDVLDHVGHVHDLVELDVGGKRSRRTASISLWTASPTMRRVGPGLLDDHQEDALFALDPGLVTGFLEGVFDLGDVAQIDRLAFEADSR